MLLYNGACDYDITFSSDVNKPVKFVNRISVRHGTGLSVDASLVSPLALFDRNFQNLLANYGAVPSTTPSLLTSFGSYNTADRGYVGCIRRMLRGDTHFDRANYTPGDYLIVPSTIPLMFIYDVSDPTRPAYGGYFGWGVFTICWGPQVVDTGSDVYVLCPDTSGNLYIYKVTNPTLPVLVNTAAMGIGAFKCIVDGNYLYAISGTSLVIIDISHLPNVTVVGTLNPGTSTNFWGIAKSGNYVYLSGHLAATDVFHSINVSNPAAPAVVGTLNNANVGSAMDLVIYGNYAFSAQSAAAGGVAVIDISTPATPVYVGLASAGISFSDLAILGNYLYAASSLSGIYAIDLTALPTISSSQVSTTAASGIASCGNYLYFSDVLTVRVAAVTSPPAFTVLGTTFGFGTTFFPVLV